MNGLPLAQPWWCYVEKALQARHLFHAEVDYVVQKGKVLIVDRDTGRINSGRRWQEGLHQAVECKEGVPIGAESKNAVRISRQRFFRRYALLGGLTGTGVVPNGNFARCMGYVYRRSRCASPCRRVSLPDRYFAAMEAKLAAIVGEIQSLAREAPSLGRRRIDRNLQPIEPDAETNRAAPSCAEWLAGRARSRHRTQAGQTGAVTIATQMAGRGTDIRLGTGVAALGGLHVIGAERHLSARVDHQLAGRAARQGDPGSCRFFLPPTIPSFFNMLPPCTAICRLPECARRSDGRFSPPRRSCPCLADEPRFSNGCS